MNRATEDREHRPFGCVRNGYPRHFFTLDPLLQEREGVRRLNLRLNLIDFMAEGGDLFA